MAARTSSMMTGHSPQVHTFDQETLQDVALACVEGIVAALTSSDTKRANHIAERLAAVLNASPLSLPPALECTCQRTMGCAHRRFGDHLKASNCFKSALAQPEGEDAFQRVNTLMLLSNSLSSLQRFDLALESALEAQLLLQKMLFQQPHLMVVNSATDNSSAPVQMVRLVVAVHFRVGVLKQQLGNHAGARDARHAIDVSKMLLGRFSLGQQMLRIVREDGTLIPVSEQLNMRSLSDNVNITGKLNTSGSNFTSAAPPTTQLAASSIYSSNSSGLSSLMPRLRVPEPDLTDPTESLHELSQMTDEHRNTHDKWGKLLPPHPVLDGTRDMWRGEFAPGLGRLQLPDVEIELTREELAGRGNSEPLHVAPVVHGPWFSQNPQSFHALQGSGHDGRAEAQVLAQKVVRGDLTGSLVDPVWIPQSSHAGEGRIPGSYANSPNVHNVARRPHNSSRFDEHAANPAELRMSGDALTRDGSSSCAVAASVRIADPDVLSGVNTDHGGAPQARQPDPLWSEHQASPMVNMLHQYLKQQHESVQEANALRDSSHATVASVNGAAQDQNMSRYMLSPRHENDSSPQPSNALEVLRNSSEQIISHAAQDDEVAGFLSSRKLPETELRMASRFKNVNTDDRMIEFTVEDFLCECASMTSAIEIDLRRELEHIALRPESELQRELESITSGVDIAAKP